MIAIYTRHKLVKSSQALLKECLEFTDAFVFSEEKITSASFVSNIQEVNPHSQSVEFSNAVIDDMIQRCRVLRCLDRAFAVSLINFYASRVISFFETFGVSVVIIPRIDDFFLDLMERLAREKGIKVIGVWNSAFVKEYSFLTCRGEIRPLRKEFGYDNLQLDLFRLISRGKFRATSINPARYSAIQKVKKFCYLYLRAAALFFMSKLTNRFSYRSHATRFFVEEYKTSFIDTIYPFHSKLFKGTIEPLDKKPVLFLALQVNPESTIDYYVPRIELINVKEVVNHVVRSALNQGFHVVVKDHPNMEGFRPRSFYKDLLSSFPSVQLLSSSVPSEQVIKQASCVFTWSGTIATEAYFHGVPSISICVPFALSLDGFYSIKDLTEFEEALQKARSKTKITTENQERMSKNIQNTLFRGVVYYHDSVSRNVGKHNLDEFIVFVKNEVGVL